MAIRLIAIDIDGTLLDSRWELPEANRKAIAEAVGRGIEVALVTGRRFDFALPIAQQLRCRLVLIVNNGALVKSKDGTTHLRHLLPRDIARRALQATPLESCLIEDPIQVMYTGPVERMREVEALLRALPLAKQFALAVTEYGSRDFGLIDVIHPACSKGATLAE